VINIEIKTYFDTFSGIGGFTLGIERAFGDKGEREQPAEEREHLERNVHPKVSDSEICDNRRNIQEQTAENNSSLSDNEEGTVWKSSCNGIRCVGFSEIDRYASAVLRYRYPDVPNYGDITKIKPEDLPDFDMLVGGTPCQDFSIAGKRKGLTNEDGTLTRSGLFYHFIRIAEAKRPKLIVLENVKGMLSSKNRDGEYNFDNMMEAICELGYAIDFTILNSKYFGVPQNRERVFVLARRLDTLKESEII
jgi:site-specific DNA-cytosine methylase